MMNYFHAVLLLPGSRFKIYQSAIIIRLDTQLRHRHLDICTPQLLTDGQGQITKNGDGEALFCFLN